jgi:hypothetical protein
VTAHWARVKADCTERLRQLAREAAGPTRAAPIDAHAAEVLRDFIHAALTDLATPRA